MNLTKDILVQIQKDFGPQSVAASQLLQNQTEFYSESLRVLRCIVFLAEGDIDLLPKFINSAKSDYRDVIFWAEYINHDAKNPAQVRDFNKPFGQHELKTIVHSKQGERLPADVKRFLNRKK
jgi:hypothetical protein